MKIVVPLKFEGEAVIDVSDNLSAEQAIGLAKKIAVAKIVATFENPDCGEALESAFEDAQKEDSVTEEQFDSAVPFSLGGVWTVDSISIKP